MHTVCSPFQPRTKPSSSAEPKPVVAATPDPPKVESSEKKQSNIDDLLGLGKLYTQASI